MKPNVYEYPTNESELPAYRVAVMQAALEGGQVELRRRGSFMHGPWHPVDADPAWNWGEADYRIVRPKARYFRKPGGLFGPTSDPSEQYCVRMLDGVCTFVDVSGDEDVASNLTRAIVEGHVSTGHWIEFDGDMSPWKPKAPPVSPVAPGHNPEGLTVEQIGEGYRTLTLEEVRINQAQVRLGDRPVGVEMSTALGWACANGNDPVITYRTKKPVGFYLPKPKIAPGHNPGNITVEQLGEGYRLLTAEEVAANDVAVNRTGKPPGGIEMWASTSWFDGADGNSMRQTYRTKKPAGFYLPKPKIAEGHNPAGVTEDQIPAGWRLFSMKEFRHLKSSDVNCAIPGTRYWRNDEWSEVDAWGLYDTFSDGTLITDKPAGFYLPKPKVKVLKPWSLTTLRWPDCIRRKGGTTGRNILTSSPYGLRVFYGIDLDSGPLLSWQMLFDNFEASFDNGRTWVPCGTEEDAS